jgi:hypothetical protein
MKSRKDLIEYIRHLLKTNKTLTPDIRQALKRAIKELRKPAPLNPGQAIEIAEILLTGLSVGIEVYKHLHT